MDIAEVFKRDYQFGDVGLEIEVEGEGLPTPPSLWRMETDGSLKGPGTGIEYVMNHPVPRGELHAVVNEFSACFKDSHVHDSIYAGIHVHANVQRLSLRQLITLLTCLFILEEVMVKWCGETREGNHFCLRSADAEWIIEFIRNMIITENPKLMKDNDNIRYSAFNLKSVPLHGSLEFRSLGSTVNPQRIFIWADTILNIVQMSQTYANPAQVIQDFKTIGAQAFMKKLMGLNSYHFNTPNADRLMRNGLFRAMDIAYAKDWDNPYNLNIFRQVKEAF